MSSKRSVRRKSCKGKKKYTTMEQAWKAAKNANAWDGSGWIVPYGCKFCGGFHIGHAPRWVKDILREKGLR